MKFWELISAFRSEKEKLQTILEKSEWKAFNAAFKDIDEIIHGI